MTAKRWLSIVIPAGLLLGLALGWMTAGAQKAKHHIIELSVGNNPIGDADTVYVDNNPFDIGVEVDYRMGVVRVNKMDPVAVEPTFKQHPQGWMPSCPAGTALIRHYPAPDCFWGTKPMRSKPTQGDMECVYTAQATKLPACPKE